MDKIKSSFLHIEKRLVLFSINSFLYSLNFNFSLSSNNNFSPDLLVASKIPTSSKHSLIDAIQKLRPSFLRPNKSDADLSSNPSVYDSRSSNKSFSSIFPPGKTYKFSNGGFFDLLTINTSIKLLLSLKTRTVDAGVKLLFINFCYMA